MPKKSWLGRPSSPSGRSSSPSADKRSGSWKRSDSDMQRRLSVESAVTVEHIEKNFNQLTDELEKTFEKMSLQNQDLLERNKLLAEENTRLQTTLERFSARSSSAGGRLHSMYGGGSDDDDDAARITVFQESFVDINDHPSRMNDLSSSLLWGKEHTDDDVASPSRRGDARQVRIASGVEESHKLSSDLDLSTDERDAVFPEWPLESAPRRARNTSGPFGLSQIKDGDILEVEGDEIDAWVISPIGCFRLCWDAFVGIVLCVQFWLTPFVLVFLPETGAPFGFRLLENAITCFFMADIFLNFNTGTTIWHDGSQKLVMKRRSIIKEYCRGWFWLDLLATIPFDRLFEQTVSSKHVVSQMLSSMRVFRWLKLLRYFRIIRALRMAKSITRKFELEIHRLKSWFLIPFSFFITLLVLSHLHACIWAWIQREADEPIDIGALYYESFMRVATTYVSGVGLPGKDVPAMWALDFAIEMERVVLMGWGGMWLIFQAMLLLEQSARFELIKDDALSYLKHREVSYKTQLHVLNQLNEAGQIERVKRRFSTWIDSGIPYELHRAICEELWVHRLASLGLIDYVMSMRPRMQVDLALLVREETLSSQSILFKEGDAPVAAYMILEGMIQTESTLCKQNRMPDFGQDMWVGEKALANPALMRTVTALCKTSTTLMAVPAEGFRKLLIDYEMLGEFEEYCVQHLWHGICGRCGAVGDHFANECPLIWLNSEYSSTNSATGGWFSRAGSQVSLQAQAALFREDCRNNEYALLADDQEEWSLARMLTNAKRDLKEFLRAQRLSQLTPILEGRGVRSLDDLEALDDEEVQEVIDKALAEEKDTEEEAAPEGMEGNLHVVRQDLLKSALSFANIQEFRDTLEERAKEALGTIEKRSQHLVFLSHHKLHAGTEASLLRQEVESLIREHPVLRKKVMDAPVFLDSEDLSNLESLQEHVMMSHNILLLLTEEVLTRPWVLVEIATANRMGIPILPVEVRKAGNKFQYPDEQFYTKLASGKLLPHSSMRVLESCKISILEIEAGIRKVFNRISFPYSPHRPAIFRRAEVEDLLRHCRHEFDLARKAMKSKRKRNARWTSGRGNGKDRGSRRVSMASEAGFGSEGGSRGSLMSMSSSMWTEGDDEGGHGGMQKLSYIGTRCSVRC